MILRALFLGASLLGMTPIMVTCQGASGPAPSPSPTLSPTATPTPTPTSTPTATPSPTPTPTPTATPTSTPTPTAAPTGLANAAYSGYVTPAPTSYPAAMPTDTLTQTTYVAELQPNPQQTPNPFATALAITIGSAGPDMSYSLSPRTDGGLTGYVLTAVNSSTTTAEGQNFTPNQAAKFDSFDTESNSADNTTTCPSYTALTYNDGSFHNCAIVITLSAGQTLYYTGTTQQQPPNTVRFYSIYNGTASAAASPTPVAVVSPTATPTPVPFTFPGDFPAQYQAAVNAQLAPSVFDTPYPVPTATAVFSVGGPPACLETAPPYYTVNGRLIYVAYCNSSTGGTFNATTQYTGGLSYQTILGVSGPTPSPTTTACHSALVVPFGSTYYGLCASANSATIVPVDAQPPTPNPSPTYSAYPGMLDTTCGASGTYLSQAGGPYPPASRQCMFLKNPMVGIIPSNAAIDPNDASYKANSGVNGTPAPIHVVGTIQGAGSSNYAYNWVTNGAPSIPVNMTCSGTCGTVGITPTWYPANYQVQGPPDCHAEQVFYALAYVEDYWQVNKPNTPACASLVYPGAPFTSVAGTRIPFNSDGTHSLITASTISPGLGLIRGQDVLDARVSTFPTGIQIAPPCTNAFWRYPAHGSDAGVGSSCSGIQPPNGAEIGLFETPAHVLSCGLDVLSQKFWMNMTVGFGHGLFITDTNGGGSSSYYVQTETDRDMTRFGVASSWQLIAKMMGVAISGDGTYSLPISTGSGCINTADIHFISPSTPNVQGTTLAP